MKSFFINILSKNNLERHDGRSLWQYNLSKEEFKELTNVIVSNLSDFRKGAKEYLYPMDVTLYFSEFWRQQYDGSRKISKELITESLDIEESKKKMLFEIASEGAKRLNLKWINVRVYDLKLRTILSQGGIPLNFLKKDNNTFATFIRRLIQSEVSTTEELKEYPEITNILPASFRNEFIYDSSFKIIEDVLNENITLNNETNESVRSLITVIKQESRKKAEKKSNEIIKFTWSLKGNHNHKLQLFCLIELPNKLKLSEDTDKIVLLNFGDNFLAKYKRNQHGDYFLIGNKLKELPIEKEQDTQIYLNGNVNLVSVKNESRPNFEKPTLWIKEDMHFEFINSNTTKAENGVIICPENWKSTNTVEIENQIETVEIDLLTYNKISFTESIAFVENDSNNKIDFRTNIDSDFSISFVTISPEWFNFSQYRIFDKKPEIQIYDRENKKSTSNFEVYYKYVGETEYSRTIDNKKLGLFELKVVLADSTLIFDYFYLISSFMIETSTINENKGQYTILNQDKFQLKFRYNDNTNIENQGDIALVENLNIKNRPKFIKVHIKNQLQTKGCNIYLDVPFSGIYLIDNNSNISDASIPLVLNNTKGYRLHIPNDKTKKYIARISNVNYPGIKSDIRLNYGSNDLLTIQEEVSKLILLSSLSSGIPKVKMDIIEENIRFPERTTRLRPSYYFKRYNTIFTKYKDENTITTYVKLYAIPFNVSDELLLPYELTFNEEEFFYTLSNLPEEVEEFCLVTDDLFYFTLPRYYKPESKEGFKIYLNNEVVDFDEFKREKPYTPLLEERIERIEKISEKLSESPLFLEGSEWSILKKYIDFCLEYKLPFNTFDHINAIATDYNLYAKFIFNILNSEKSIDELIEVIKKIEDNLGVSLLWVPIKTWIDLFSNEEIDILINRFMELMRCFYSSNKYAIEIVNFIFTKAPDLFEEKSYIKINTLNSELRKEIESLRQEIGGTINDLPPTRPSIQSYFRSALPIDLSDNPGLNTVKLSPLAVALSISGNSTRIWKESVKNSKENTEFVKRIILYISNLYPNWYYKTIYHFIKK